MALTPPPRHVMTPLPTWSSRERKREGGREGGRERGGGGRGCGRCVVKLVCGVSRCAVY